MAGSDGRQGRSLVPVDDHPKLPNFIHLNLRLRLSQSDEPVSVLPGHHIL